MQLRMYKYRIYPSQKQKVRIINSLKICKEVYYTLLDLNKKLLVTRKYDLNSLVMDLKCCNPSIKDVHSQVLQNVSDRLSKAFENFFRRVKDPSCKEKGFPRFKSRVNSIIFPQSGFKLLSNKKLRLSKIGSVPIILHRVPKGKIKTLTIKQNKAGQWFAIFSCEVDIPIIKHQSTERVGVDVGIENFATLSNGEIIANPRHLIKSEKRIKLLQRRLSRKVKGSSNRRKARFRLARQHLKVSNQRTDFIHKISRKLINSYSFIAVEDLEISNMVHNHHLAKHITDASWSAFIRNLEYKAVTSDSRFVKVNPRNTSKTCSECGIIIEMPLSKREFLCLNCGFVCHRDLNASINILKVGMDYAELNACEDTVRPSLKAGVVEAGTTLGSF